MADKVVIHDRCGLGWVVYQEQRSCQVMVWVRTVMAAITVMSIETSMGPGTLQLEALLTPIRSVWRFGAKLRVLFLWR